MTFNLVRGGSEWPQRDADFRAGRRGTGTRGHCETMPGVSCIVRRACGGRSLFFQEPPRGTLPLEVNDDNNSGRKHE